MRRCFILWCLLVAVPVMGHAPWPACRLAPTSLKNSAGMWSNLPATVSYDYDLSGPDRQPGRCAAGVERGQPCPPVTRWRKQARGEGSPRSGNNLPQVNYTRSDRGDGIAPATSPIPPDLPFSASGG